MISAWRIVKRQHLEHAFSGEGARLYGGRWNSPGRLGVYVSESRALATLEILTGLGSTAVVPAYVLIEVVFDAELVAEVDVDDLEDGWYRSPPTFETQRIGDAWLQAGTTAVLRIPSAVVRGEFNYLLNPAHSDFARIQTGDPETLYLDPRVLPS